LVRDFFAVFFAVFFGADFFALFFATVFLVFLAAFALLFFAEVLLATTGFRARLEAGRTFRLARFTPETRHLWHGNVRPLEVEELAPLRHQRILQTDVDGAAKESVRNYVAWKAERETLLANGSKPSLLVQTVTSLVRSASGRAEAGTEGNGSSDSLGVEVARVERGSGVRPGGRRFGALVHALLASIDLRANAAAVEAAAVIHGRIVGATAEEIRAAVAAIGRVLEHPILRRAARAAKECVRRESPVMLARKDGPLVEGVIDLAFREETPEFSGWTVVDFKTDREFEETSDQYIAQVRVYSEAVATATRVNVRGRIPVCGMISTYNGGGDPVANLFQLIYGRIRMEGFVSTDFAHLRSGFEAEMTTWLKSGPHQIPGDYLGRV
jgi:hypothetical protein